MNQVVDTKSTARAVDIRSINNQVFDSKPRGKIVLDTKPTNTSVIDTKSKGKSVSKETVVFIDSRSIPAGQMIPWAGFTYPVGLTFDGVRL